MDYLLSNRWIYGEIKKIQSHDNQGGKYRVLYIQPQMEGMYQTHRTSHHHSRRHQSQGSDDGYEYTQDFTLSPQTLGQIAKPLTKSMEYAPKMLQWRKDLKVNGKCDVLDSVHKWYTCTILEDDPGANRFKINYDGWSSRYDEFIYRY